MIYAKLLIVSYIPLSVYLYLKNIIYLEIGNRIIGGSFNFFNNFYFIC